MDRVPVLKPGRDERLIEIFEREIEIETAEKMVVLTKISDNIRKCQKDLDRLRKEAVMKFYMDSFQDLDCVEQPSIHPAVKKLIGKQPRSSSSTDNYLKSNVWKWKRETRKQSLKEYSKIIPRRKQNTVKEPNDSDNNETIVRPCYIPPIIPGNPQENSTLRGNTKKMHIRVLVGNIAKPVNRDYDDEASHKWMVYVRSAPGPGSLSVDKQISRVRFFLHPSYKPHDVITVPSPPFILNRRGWGEFPMRVQLYFKNSLNKPADIIHNLKLNGARSGHHTRSAETFADLWIHPYDNSRLNQASGSSSGENQQILMLASHMLKEEVPDFASEAVCHKCLTSSSSVDYRCTCQSQQTSERAQYAEIGREQCSSEESDSGESDSGDSLSGAEFLGRISAVANTRGYYSDYQEDSSALASPEHSSSNVQESKNCIKEDFEMKYDPLSSNCTATKKDQPVTPIKEEELDSVCVASNLTQTSALDELVNIKSEPEEIEMKVKREEDTETEPVNSDHAKLSEYMNNSEFNAIEMSVKKEVTEEWIHQDNIETEIIFNYENTTSIDVQDVECLSSEDFGMNKEKLPLNHKENTGLSAASFINNFVVDTDVIIEDIPIDCFIEDIIDEVVVDSPVDDNVSRTVEDNCDQLKRDSELIASSDVTSIIFGDQDLKKEVIIEIPEVSNFPDQVSFNNLATLADTEQNQTKAPVSLVENIPKDLKTSETNSQLDDSANTVVLIKDGNKTIKLNKGSIESNQSNMVKGGSLVMNSSKNIVLGIQKNNKPGLPSIPTASPAVKSSLVSPQQSLLKPSIKNILPTKRPHNSNSLLRPTLQHLKNLNARNTNNPQSLLRPNFKKLKLDQTTSQSQPSSSVLKYPIQKPIHSNTMQPTSIKKPTNSSIVPTSLIQKPINANTVQNASIQKPMNSSIVKTSLIHKPINSNTVQLCNIQKASSMLLKSKYSTSSMQNSSMPTFQLKPTFNQCLNKSSEHAVSDKLSVHNYSKPGVLSWNVKHRPLSQAIKNNSPTIRLQSHCTVVQSASNPQTSPVNTLVSPTKNSNTQTKKVINTFVLKPNVPQQGLQKNLNTNNQKSIIQTTNIKNCVVNQSVISQPNSSVSNLVLKPGYQISSSSASSVDDQKNCDLNKATSTIQSTSFIPSSTLDFLGHANGSDLPSPTVKNNKNETKALTNIFKEPFLDDSELKYNKSDQNSNHFLETSDLCFEFSADIENGNHFSFDELCRVLCFPKASVPGRPIGKNTSICESTQTEMTVLSCNSLHSNLLNTPLIRDEQLLMSKAVFANRDHLSAITNEQVFYYLEQLRLLLNSCQFEECEMAVRWLIRGLPLVHPDARFASFKMVHPYCAPSYMTHCSWPQAKQASAEWLRAKTVVRMLSALKTKSVWSTKTVYRWAQHHGYSPAYHLSGSKSPNSTDDEGDENAFERLNTKTQPHNVVEWMTSVLANREAFKDEDIDILGLDTKPTGVPECSPHTPGMVDWGRGVVSGRPWVSDAQSWVRREANKTSVCRLGLEPLLPGGSNEPITTTLLTHTTSLLAEDLLRRSTAAAAKRGSSSVLPEDVCSAILKRPEFDIFSEEGLDVNFSFKDLLKIYKLQKNPP